MAKVAALCPCGKPPAAGVAVIVYRFKSKKQKTSRTFHLCASCASDGSVVAELSARAFEATYKALEHTA